MIRPRVILDVIFDNDEMEATIEAAARWKAAQDPAFWAGRTFIEPSRERHIQLTLEGTNINDIERLYRLVFPERHFAGVEPMPGIDVGRDGFYFLLSDGINTYDIVEMSSGEQAVFPIMYEFVRMQIGKSVVIIDEIDMHLHPPAAQALVQALYQIGPTCQFIFSTHAEAVAAIISPEEAHRLKRGVVCL